MTELKAVVMTVSEATGWIGEPAQEGDNVEVRNPYGRAWRKFVCVRHSQSGELYLREVEPGETRKLINHRGYNSISFDYNGYKRVVGEG